MKKVLVLGAGLVARPLVQYLLDQPDLQVQVASRTLSKAEKLVGNHPRGQALPLNVTNEVELENLVKNSDLTISMVPYAHHVQVAKLCIKYKKHMVTTSYVSDAMKALDGEARAAGILILNEIGLDPGIDHMSAMKIIHEGQNNGGQVVSFKSYCGGLPAPEANTNPLGYKFSWSPRGVILAARNAAKFLENGKLVDIPGEKLFDYHWDMTIDGIELETYPNRNSLPYLDWYGIQSAQTIYRGTLRYRGWSETIRKIVDLGLLNIDERQDLHNMSLKQFLAMVVICKPEELKDVLIKKYGIAADSHVMKKLEWLGMLSDTPIPAGQTSILDVLTTRMLDLMAYLPGERDMVVLHHDFIIGYPNKKEHITSTLVDYGIPNGDSSMSRTVGMPAAIGAALILRGKIDQIGVHIPVTPQIYLPVLAELEKNNIICKEKTELI